MTDKRSKLKVGQLIHGANTWMGIVFFGATINGRYSVYWFRETGTSPGVETYITSYSNEQFDYSGFKLLSEPTT